jgi:hypothetical protein
MENDLKALEDVLIHGPGHVKRGLLWLGSEEAREMGLSLDSLIYNALVDPENSEDFDLSFCNTCALGYAGDDGFADVSDQKGTDWLREHGFVVGDPFVSPLDQSRAYEALTDEWRTQLRALADERRPA